MEIYFQQNGSTYKLKLSANAYPLLEQWFPEKEYEYVISKNQTVTNTNDRFDEIKKYKELLDNGIISNEEFETKKKEQEERTTPTKKHKMTREDFETYLNQSKIAEEDSDN